MRTLSEKEIDQVGGGIDSLNIGGISVTGIEAGIALRNIGTSVGAAFAFGYGIGTLANSGYTAVSGNTLGTDIYNATEQCW